MGTATTEKSLSTRRGGRPKGSRNKPKGTMLPAVIAEQVLSTLKETLPPEHYEYMRQVIKEGKAVSSERELDIMILLLGRNLVPAILAEGGKPIPGPDGEIEWEMPAFRKDVTERLAQWTRLVELKRRAERENDERADTSKKPLLEITVGRGFDTGRLALLIGGQPSDMGRTADGPERESDSSRTLSDSVFERPLYLPSGSEGATVRVLDNTLDRDDALSDDEDKL
jgi:hypothetical protein